MSLRSVRESLGKSQGRVAKDLGIEATQLSLWERGGKRPRIDKLVMLADYYGVTLDRLVGRACRDELPGASDAV